MTAADLVVDQHSSVPVFEQVRRQLIDQITDHRLVAGDKLPAVRVLAEQLGLAPGTIAKVYRELESAGYVVTQGRNGTRVSDIAAADPEQDRAADRLTAEYVAALRRLGLGEDAAVSRVRSAFAAPER